MLAELVKAGKLPPVNERLPQDPAVIKPSSHKAEQGLVWMFPGLVGAWWELGPAYRGLRDAGLDKQVRFFQWAVPAPDFFAHLFGTERNVAQARAVVDEIVEYRRLYPDEPIDLVGYSAGGYLALVVAEMLPPEVRLHNVVLAQPDVSPTYDLTVALEHVDGKLVNFYSSREWMLSGLFTTLFGTMDRQYVPSAGKDGFDLEVAVPDETLRAKVEQVPWTAEMSSVGSPSNHVTVFTYEWNKYFVAPYVVDPDDLDLGALPWEAAATDE